MIIEIRMKDGRVVEATLPDDKAISSGQLAIMTKWAVEGKSAEVMHD